MKALNTLILISSLAIFGTAHASHHKTGEESDKAMPEGRQHSQECKEATGGKGKAMGKCRSEKAHAKDNEKEKKSHTEEAEDDQQSEAKKDAEKQREDSDEKGVKTRDGDWQKKSGRPEDRGDESDD